jgi:hypothetical protein
MTTSTLDRIAIQGELIGGDSNARLRKNSQDLARQDGRSEAREADRVLALCELTKPDEDSAPEVPAGAESLVTWDVSPEVAGHLIPEIQADDEADFSAEEAEEGREEAEQDLRRAVHAESRFRHDSP